MKIDEYVKESIERLKAFQKWWLEMNKKEPEHFPLDLNPGDWDEQEMVFKQEES